MSNDNKKPWGGRFSGSQSGITERISSSVHFDARLFEHDILGSIAHARMLHRMNILTEDELNKIVGALLIIVKEIENGTFTFNPSLEDVHMNIESRLTDMIGSAGKKLHTARSRNDQISLDMRLYVKDEADVVSMLLRRLILVLAEKAEQNIDLMMPGYTHLQVAQPVRFSQHVLAYAWMLVRDMERLEAARKSADRLPLGSGALAGVNFSNDREFLRRELGFAEIIPNSMDAVSDRDVVLDFLSFAAVLGVHLSRLCEDLVLWSTAEFGYIRLSDSVTTGSSIMPQKRNPDIAELIRGKSGRLSGNLISLLTVMKGLPMAYNRDMQEDKEPLFDSADTVKDSLEGMIEMIATMSLNADRMRASLYKNFSTATDLADYLVMKGIPFRESHEIVGRVVRHCEEKGADFFTLSPEKLKEFSPAFSDDVREVLDPATSAERKKSMGGTAKSEIQKQIAMLKDKCSFTA